MNVEQLLKHSGWMRSLARQLVRDSASVDDLMQETWAAALVRPPAQPRAAVSWLKRVLHNRAHTQRRRDDARGRRERSIAQPELQHGSRPDLLLETLELQREVVDRVLTLQEPLRSTLFLRFFDELGCAEIAQRQGVAVSTVRFRIQRALEHLRVQLDSSHGSRRRWHSALAPLLPVSGGGAVGLTTQTTTGASSAGSAAGHVPGGSLLTAGMTIGGAVMSKKLIGVVGLAVLLALTAGIGVGGKLESARRSGDAAEDSAATIEASMRREIEQLRAQLESNEHALATARTGSQRAGAELAAYKSRVAELEAAAAALHSESLGDARDTADGASGIDWDHLYDLIATNAELGERIAEFIRKGEDPTHHLSAKELSALAVLEAELQKAAAKARVKSPYPFLDGEILPEYLRVLLGATLDLSDAQLGSLLDSTMPFLEEFGDLDAELPIRLVDVRRQVVERVRGALDEVLSPEQKEAWERNSPAINHLLDGDSERLQYGLKREKTTADVLKYWKRHYGYPAESEATVRQLAESYVESARGLFATQGGANQRLRQLDPAKRQALESAYLQLQMQMEEQLLPLLSEQALTELLGKQPGLLLFDDTNNVSIRSGDTAGF